MEEVKQYLSQLFYLRKKIDSDKRELTVLYEVFYSPKGISYEERVQCSPTGSRVDMMLSKIEEQKKLIQREMNNYLNTYAEIRKTIMSVDDDKLQLVLKLRYIELLTWQAVADEMDITLQWTHELHKRALEILTKK